MPETPGTYPPTPQWKTKYHRLIWGRNADGEAVQVWIDVYNSLESFKFNQDGTPLPYQPGDVAIDHAVKKLLCPGQRGGKGRLQDLTEALISVQRAIDATILNAP
jgi:hypothetical protein